MTAIVFIVRFILMMTIWRQPQPRARASRRRTVPTVAGHYCAALPRPGMRRCSRFAYPFLAVWTSGGMTPGRYWIDLGVLVLTYVLLGWGLNIVVGLAGLLDLGYVAFYAVGAYTFALLSMNYDLSFWVCLPLAGIIAAMFGVRSRLSGAAPARRLSRHRHARLRRDHPPRPHQLARIHRRRERHQPHPAAELLRASNSCRADRPASRNSSASPFAGPPADLLLLRHPAPRLRRASRHDPPPPPADRPRLGGAARRRDRLPLARHFGRQHEAHGLRARCHVRRLRRHGLRGAPGLYSAVRTSPSSSRRWSLAIVVLGGLGSNLGVVFSALVLIGGVELLRNLGFLKKIFGPDFDPFTYRMLIFGLVMVVIMVWQPRGLISSRTPTVFLREKKTVSAEMISEGRG